MAAVPGRTFTCEVCGGTFTAAWSLAEADAEAEKRCGVQHASAKVGPADDEMAVLCEDCFKRVMAAQPS
jgi:hypothetical protein